MITYDEFKKLDLRTAKIISAGRIEGSDKLIKLELDLGQEKRQIIAGIGRTYNPEDLADKTIVIVANLETKMLMGLASQGMILAAHGANDRPVILIPEMATPPGSAIS